MEKNKQVYQKWWFWIIVVLSIVVIVLFTLVFARFSYYPEPKVDNYKSNDAGCNDLCNYYKNQFTNFCKISNAYGSLLKLQNYQGHVEIYNCNDFYMD